MHIYNYNSTYIHSFCMMAETDLSGWERFFEELCSLIRNINRQRGTANKDFSEYVIERLEVSIRSVSALIYHLRSNTPTDEEAARVGVQYSANLSELLECLRSMLREWQDYLNHYQSRSASSYRASVTPSARPGRPRFQGAASIFAFNVIYVGPNI